MTWQGEPWLLRDGLLHCRWTQTASGTGREYSIAHGAGEPSGAGPDYSGLSRRALGLCRGERDAGEPTDRDALFGACRRTGSIGSGSIGSAGRPRAPGTGCEDYGGGQNLACRAGLREADAIWLSARAVDHPTAGCACARSRTARWPCRAWQTWPRERCARSSPRMRSNRTGCVTTWSGAMPDSNPKWPRCFASIVRSRCGGRPWVELHRSPPSR